MEKFDVIGLGNALLDFQVEVPFEFLQSQGLEKGTMTLVEESFQKDLVEAVQNHFGSGTLARTAGGSAANTIAGITNFKGSAAYIGKVGNDENGRLYRRSLKDRGIHDHFVPDSSAPTGTCIALITPDAERTMLTHLGIAVDLGPKDLNEALLRSSRILHLEGYLWDSKSARAASLEAIEIMQSHGGLSALTYSDAHCVERHHKDFVELSKTKLDIIFANENEAKKATGSVDGVSAFRVLKDWAKYVCVTLGPRGALLSDRSSGETTHIPTWDVTVIDKLGAGDLFASGFLYSITHGHSLTESGYLGCYASTKVIQQVSARLTEDFSPSISTIMGGPGEEACPGDLRLRG